MSSLRKGEMKHTGIATTRKVLSSNMKGVSQRCARCFESSSCAINSQIILALSKRRKFQTLQNTRKAPACSRCSANGKLLTARNGARQEPFRRKPGTMQPPAAVRKGEVDHQRPHSSGTQGWRRPPAAARRLRSGWKVRLGHVFSNRIPKAPPKPNSLSTHARLRAFPNGTHSRDAKLAQLTAVKMSATEAQTTRFPQQHMLP